MTSEKRVEEEKSRRKEFSGSFFSKKGLESQLVAMQSIDVQAKKKLRRLER
jgi:hypothetical protein